MSLPLVKMELLLPYIFLCLFFAAALPVIYGSNEKIEKLKEHLLIDPDISSSVRVIDGRDAAIFQAFQSFEIDIKPSAVDDMRFFFASENNNTVPHNSMMKCESQCFITFKNSINEEILCHMGDEACRCSCAKDHNFLLDFAPDKLLDVYPYSYKNLKYFFKFSVCPPAQLIKDIKDNQPVIRAKMQCIDIKSLYTLPNYLPEICLFGIFSLKDQHPFFKVEMTKSLFQETDSSKVLLYYSGDMANAPNSNITFDKNGWPRIYIQPKINNQRYVLLKPDKIRNFPGFIFDYNDKKCNGAKFSIRFFDRDDCRIYITTVHSINTDPYFIVSPFKYDDDTRIEIKPGLLSDFIMYYNSPNIRFSNHTVAEFYESTTFFLCEHEVGEKFVFEIIEIDFGYDCLGFGLITGPEVVVEVENVNAYLMNTVSPDNVTMPFIETTNASNKSPSNKTTETPKINKASVDPLVIACLSVALIVFISVINFFLIRRKWFKDSRAKELILDIFSNHWQFVAPPTEPINKNNEDDENEKEADEEEQ